MGKINNKSVPLYNILNGLPKDMPFSLIKELASWNIIIKLPYGFSYYNAPVGWDFKAHDSLRIADHWNFTSKGKTHCKTTTQVPSNTHYTIAKYDTITNGYLPIHTYLKSTINVKDTISYKLLHSDVVRQRAITNLSKELDHNANADFYLKKFEITYATKMLDLFEEFMK